MARPSGRAVVRGQHPAGGSAPRPYGPVQAATTFRTAVPDLSCELAELLVMGDRLGVRLRFRGHFSGSMNGISGTGQAIDFIAFDIQHVGQGEIIEDWQLEDNLTFLQRAGLVTIASASA